MKHNQSKRHSLNPSRGIGQLTLVEHALCPLSQSEDTSTVHRTGFQYVDQAGKRRTAAATISAPFGLRPADELFLWGMLGLTLAQPDVSPEFSATPHFILKSLGCINAAGDRGGSAYRSFRESLRRLAVITYQCNAFYDPARSEHRETAFGFLSYSLPVDPKSNRAWRIVWDPLFFEFCCSARGCLSFEMAVYRELDPAARRLYLFLSKIFWRRQWTHWIDLRNLAVDVLGFSSSIANRNLKQKVKRAILCLCELQIVDLCQGNQTRNLFADREDGSCVLRLKRGPNFRRRSLRPDTQLLSSLPIYEPLRSIGLDDSTISWVAQTFAHNLIQQWADITLAAKERHGKSFFKKSPPAYFVDNLKHAAAGNRTPPDWWWECRRENEKLVDAPAAKQLVAQVFRLATPSQQSEGRDEKAFVEYLRGEGCGQLEELLPPIIADLRRSGMPADEAQRQASQLCVAHLRTRFLQR